MEVKILKALIVLGVAGVALGVLYLLLRGFSFRFSEIDATWAAVIAIVFLVIVGATTVFALHRFAPATAQAHDGYAQRKKNRESRRIGNMKHVSPDASEYCGLALGGCDVPRKVGIGADAG